MEIEAAATLKARWPSLQVHAELEPASTIVPDPTSRTVIAREVLGQLTAERRPRPLEVDEEVLGRGGMSVVRLGRQPSLGRMVAVKELPTVSDERASLELLREAWITGRLEHPNVMPVYDVAVDETGRPRLVLKRIEGVPWRLLMEDPEEVVRRFGVSEAIRWHLQVLMQVCNAVHYAHSHDVLHRDLKSDNVMVGAFGEVYVLDWGIALAGKEGVFPAPMGIVGTPAYMAPEMVSGDPLSVRTDVYLLGGLLYEILVGRPPHAGTSIQALAWNALVSNPGFPEDAPEELVAVARRCLSRDPSSRFESAEAVRRALQRALELEESNALMRDGVSTLERLEARVGEVGTEVHDLYGACSFAFQAALERWEGNEAARAGRNRARRAMVEHALGRGDAAGAAERLAQIDDAPAELVSRVEDALAREAEERGRVAKLERFRSDLDRSVAQTARYHILLAIGVIWVSLPIIQHFTTGPEHLSPVTGAVLPAAYFAALSAIIYFRRGDLWRNRYNRRFWAAVLLTFAGEAIFDVGMLVRGMSGLDALIADLAWRGLAISMVSIFVERIVMFAAMAYALAYVIASVWPSTTLLSVAVADVILVASLAVRWRPRAG